MQEEGISSLLKYSIETSIQLITIIIHSPMSSKMIVKFISILLNNIIKILTHNQIFITNNSNNSSIINRILNITMQMMIVLINKTSRVESTTKEEV